MANAFYQNICQLREEFFATALTTAGYSGSLNRNKEIRGVYPEKIYPRLLLYTAPEKTNIQRRNRFHS